MAKYQPTPEKVVALLDQILLVARTKGIRIGDLTTRAGVRPEIVSRIRTRGTAEIAVLERLANEVGLQLTLTPADSALDQIRRGEFLP